MIALKVPISREAFKRESLKRSDCASQGKELFFESHKANGNAMEW